MQSLLFWVESGKFWREFEGRCVLAASGGGLIAKQSKSAFFETTVPIRQEVMKSCRVPHNLCELPPRHWIQLIS